MKWVTSKELKLGDIILGVRSKEKEFRARAIVLSVSKRYVDVRWAWGDMEWFDVDLYEFALGQNC